MKSLIQNYQNFRSLFFFRILKFKDITISKTDDKTKLLNGRYAVLETLNSNSFIDGRKQELLGN